MIVLKILELVVWLIAGLTILISDNVSALQYGLCWATLLVKILIEALCTLKL